MKGVINMGYALRIDNVDFSSVALAQVEYVDRIPCTGVALSPSSLTFEKAEESKQLTATKTPSNTTDVLFWESSNENVATVDNAGIVTIHGIGTATISVTCGEASASITVNQTTLKAQYDLQIIEGKALWEAGSGDAKYISTDTNNAETIVGQSYHAENTDLRIAKGQIDIECVRVPYGATKAYIKTSDDVRVTISYMYIASTTEKVTIGSAQFAKSLGRVDFFYTDIGKAVEYGQCIIFRPGNSRDTSTLSYIYFE